MRFVSQIEPKFMDETTIDDFCMVVYARVTQSIC